jgi:hypothetical protein
MPLSGLGCDRKPDETAQGHLRPNNDLSTQNKLTSSFFQIMTRKSIDLHQLFSSDILLSGWFTAAAMPATRLGNGGTDKSCQRDSEKTFGELRYRHTFSDGCCLSAAMLRQQALPWCWVVISII